MQDDSRASRRKAAGIILLVCLGVSLIVVFVSQLRQSDHQKQLLVQQQQKFAATATADPILNYLPYGDRGYLITPTFEVRDGKRVLVLDISVTLYDSEYKLNPADLQALVAARKNQALAYIVSKGFSPDKYAIEYSLPAL